MSSLTFFPILLDYSMISPLILRVVLGVTLAYFGYQKIKGAGQSSGSNSRVYGYLEVVVGIFLIIGLFTQASALINAGILIIKIFFKITERKFLTDGVNYYILLLAIALSLLFVGPGYWAVDATF